MNVRLPDGTVINNVPDNVTRSQLAAKLQSNGMNVPKEWMSQASASQHQGMQVPGGIPTNDQGTSYEVPGKPVDSGVAATARGIGENVIRGAAGAVAGPVGAIGGLQYGEPAAGADTFNSKVQGLLDKIIGPMSPRGQDIATKMSESPTAQSIMNEIPYNASLRIAAPPKEAMMKAPKVEPGTPKAEVPQEMVESGLKIPPAMTGTDSAVAKLLGAWGGKIQTRQAASAMNVDRINELAVKDLGLPKGTPITRKNLTPMREEYGGLRDEINRFGRDKVNNLRFKRDAEMDAAFKKIAGDKMTVWAEEKEAAPPEYKSLFDALQRSDYPPSYVQAKVRMLRNEATDNIRKGNGELGRSQKATADALEDFLERRISQSGNRDLLSRFQAARTRVAKSYDYEEAANELGDVNAPAFARLTSDKKLTGQGKTIATAGSVYPKAVQPSSTMGGYEPFSAVDALAGAAAAGSGNTDLMGTILGRPLARQALLSDFGQRRWAIPDTVPKATSYGQAVQMAQGNPQLLAAILRQNQIVPPPPQGQQ